MNFTPSTKTDTTPIPRLREAMFKLQSMLFLVSIYAICVAPAAFAQVRYQITRIPTAQGADSVALGINNKEEVVGYSFRGDDYQAFLYSSSDQSLTDVGSLGGKINAACAINDAGQVTGYSQDGNGNLLAFLFSRTQPIASLGTLDGASTSEAFGINSHGAVVGDSQSGTQNHRPALFSNGSVQDLGIGGSNEPDALETAYAINDAGQIVGTHKAEKNAYAFVSLNGNTTDLPTLGGANGEALAINKNGQVVGDSETQEGAAHAFVYYHSQLKDLGTLPGFDKASYARGINDSGDIVGESESANQKRAFLYTRGRLIELDKLAENLSETGFTSLDVAYGISNKGWIVGYGTTSDNLTAAFVAAPGGSRNQVIAGGAQKPQAGRQEGPPSQPQEDIDQGQEASEPDEEDYDVFYTGLSSDEGNWVEAGDYGYCFRPRVSRDWRPYRDGHWVWTDQGWYWDSNERFAWATYHYGRWADIGGAGWCWVPGTRWAPAWVSWRQSDQEVGWAPLPPEAQVSGDGSISSWSDSYYDIGPAAYAFIRYSHWHEPSYARFVERPERNIQIIRETKNVTNIVTNNNVINNFGPPVQTVATRTNRNIQQVNLALTPVKGPKANFGQTLRGNQLTVVAPTATLKPQATNAPPVQSKIANPRVRRGWQGVKPQETQKLKRTIAEQNPPPKDQPKPPPFVKPQIGNKGKTTGSPNETTGAPTSVAGQKTPNLAKPGQRLPNPDVTSAGSPEPPAAGKKPVPPNLLGGKPSGTASPVLNPPGTLGGPPKPGGKPSTTGSPILRRPPSGNVPAQMPPKGTPPNLMAPRPSTTPVPPGSQRQQAAGGPTPKPTGNLPSGQNTPHARGVPDNAATPTEGQKPGTAPTRQELKTPPPQAPLPAATPPSEVRPVPAAQPPVPTRAPAAPTSTPAAPVPAPTAPKPAPTAPKPAPTAPKPAPTAPKPAPAATRSAPAATKPAPAAPRPAAPAPKSAPVTRRPAPAAPKPAPAAPKPAPAAPRPAREAPRPAPAAPRPAPAAPRPAPAAPRPAPAAPRPAPAAPRPAPAAPRPAPAAPKPAPPHGGQKPAPAKGKPTPTP